MFLSSCAEPSREVQDYRRISWWPLWHNMALYLRSSPRGLSFPETSVRSDTTFVGTVNLVYWFEWDTIIFIVTPFSMVQLKYLRSFSISVKSEDPVPVAIDIISEVIENGSSRYTQWLVYISISWIGTPWFTGMSGSTGSNRSKRVVWVVQCFGPPRSLIGKVLRSQFCS